MNDLTQNELQELQELVEFEIDNYGSLSQKSIDILIPMSDKLKFMIDGFGDALCDHYHTMTDTITKCAHCAKILGY